jgi:uncharacterized membrane protein YdjX (TVP38/TMEM64 family)
MNFPTFWTRYRGLVLVLAFLSLLLLCVQLSGLRQHFNMPYLRQTLLGNQWEGLALFVLLFTLGNLVQVPGWIFLASAVLVLGKWDGGLVTYVAACVACAVTFLSVRLVGGDTVRQLQGKLALRLVAQLHAHPIRNVVLLRTLFQTLAALNYTLAMSGIGFRQYMVATFLGLPLPIAAYCLLFDTIEKAMHLA